MMLEQTLGRNKKSQNNIDNNNILVVKYKILCKHSEDKWHWILLDSFVTTLFYLINLTTYLK